MEQRLCVQKWLEENCATIKLTLQREIREDELLDTVFCVCVRSVCLCVENNNDVRRFVHQCVQTAIVNFFKKYPNRESICFIAEIYSQLRCTLF